MKRPLIFMTERVQIEGKLQVSLIPASSIVVHFSQTNYCKKRQQDFEGAGQHLYACGNYKK